jgi:NAD(P)H-flavin reductase
MGGELLLVAGGLGLVPLRPALYALFEQRTAYGRLALLYGTRTPDDIVYQPELQKWHKRRDLQMEITVDRAGSDWQGHVGVVTRLIPGLGLDPTNTMAMLCGPEIMMRFTVWELLQRGVKA